MKFLLVSLYAAAVVSGAGLKDVKSVYIYPMTAGFDQHLANRLTQDHIFQVVSDPKMADAVLTENLGASFEYKLDRLQAPKPAVAIAVPTSTAAVSSTPAVAPAPSVTSTPMASPVADSEPRASSFSRGKGTIFLVDAKSKIVIWSAYQKPKNTTPDELEKTAKKVSAGLAVSLK